MFVMTVAGDRFGKLTLLQRERVETYGTMRQLWRCQCDCGIQKHYPIHFLKRGNVVSCGCARDRRAAAMNRSHGRSRSGGAYKSWTSMRHRCNNPNAPMYYAYGAKGVRCCERWDSFEAFLEDMGERPNGYSLERLDVNGHYEPGNCVWLPMAQQAKNKTTSRYVLLNGERMIQADAARKLGVMPQTMNKWRAGVNKQPEHLDLVWL